MEKTAHVISHSHWDREWYLPFETHRYYFIQLMNDIVEQFEKNENKFSSFHLDGQTVLLEDYYDVHPEKKEFIGKLIREKKLIIGPWYVLQDAFLTSSEANVRNLLVGLHDTKEYGETCMIGYFPDTFGIYGQAPQILKQAGIESAAFGRGVKPTGFNNKVSDSATFESPFSEMIWEAPDGSKVLGILFANWYSNGNEIPIEKTESKKFWDEKLEDAEKYASTNQLLFLNGCDHQPLQKTITEALAVASELYPEYKFKHSSFEEYLVEVKKSLPDELQVVKGELRSQRTDGWETLVNTASSRIYLKQWNDFCQRQLEKLAEPLATMNFMGNGTYKQEYIRFMWKSLMKNHPHDSICGCSVDAVHRDMVSRFESVSHMTDIFIREQAASLARSIDTSHINHSEIPLVVINTTGWSKNEVVEATVDIEKVYFSQMNAEEIPNYLSQKLTPNYQLVNELGNIVEFQFEGQSIEFGYDLPNDKFRQPYFAKKLKLSFFASEIPKFGYKTFFLAEKNGEIQFVEKIIEDVKDKFDMENEHVHLQFHNDGSYDLTDKKTGHVFKKLGVYENTGDIGNEYMFKESTGQSVFTTSGIEANFKLIEKNSLRTILEFTQELILPVSAEAYFEVEKSNLIYHKERISGRSDEMTSVHLRTVITLEKESKGPEFKLFINNTAKDHRFRVLFPTNLKTESHFADSIFEIVNRSNTPERDWENPSFCMHMQRFSSVSDGHVGLTIATAGLHEYEVLPEKSTIAVTILRSVSELGDWGYFPTPEAQCLGMQFAEWVVLPHKSDVIQSEIFVESFQYKVPLVIVQTDRHAGNLPFSNQFINVSGNGLVWSSLKVAENSDDIIMRWYNPGSKEHSLTFSENKQLNVYKSTIVEDRSTDFCNEYKVNHHEIITIGMVQK